VNIRVKFYSIQGATVYDTAYSAYLDLHTFFNTCYQIKNVIISASYYIR